MHTILLVDDEPDILQALSDLVGMEFPEVGVKTAADPEEALEILAKGLPTVIVSDFRMPKMNGLDFLREARKRHGDLAAILLTAFPDRRLAVEAAQEGIIRRFYIKPPDVAQILAGIKELLDPESVEA